MTLEQAYANWEKYRDQPDSEERKKAHHDLIYAGYKERLRIGDKGKLGIPELEAHKTSDFREFLGLPDSGKPQTKAKKGDAAKKTKVITKLRKAGPATPELELAIPPTDINRRGY